MHPHDFFWIDTVCCTDVGLRLQSPVTFSTPQPDVETVSVPGRNGDLVFFRGGYGNIAGKARCFALMPDRVDIALNAIAKWTLSDPGYHRLTVSNEPDVYRLARVSIGPQTEIRVRRLAPFELAFDCKPQKFFPSGEFPVSLEAPGELYNAFGFNALPRITVHGNGPGTLSVDGVTVDIKALDGFLILDSETQNAYKDTQNKNRDISAGEFPVLHHGKNYIGWTGGIQRVEIIPRWWTL